MDARIIEDVTAAEQVARERQDIERTVNRFLDLPPPLTIEEAHALITQERERLQQGRAPRKLSAPALSAETASRWWTSVSLDTPSSSYVPDASLDAASG